MAHLGYITPELQWLTPKQMGKLKMPIWQFYKDWRKRYSMQDVGGSTNCRTSSRRSGRFQEKRLEKPLSPWVMVSKPATYWGMVAKLLGKRLLDGWKWSSPSSGVELPRKKKKGYRRSENDRVPACGEKTSWLQGHIHIFPSWGLGTKKERNKAILNIRNFRKELGITVTHLGHRPTRNSEHLLTFYK